MNDVSTAIIIPQGILEEAAQAAYESAVEAAGIDPAGTNGWGTQTEECHALWRAHIKTAGWVILTRLREAGWTVRP